MKYYITLFLALIGLNVSHCIAQDISGKDKYIFNTAEVIIGPDDYSTEDCYYWEPKELLIDNTMQNPTARVSETTTFIATATGKDFSYTKTESMTVHLVKIEEISGLESYICQGSDLTLTAKLTDNIPLPDDWKIVWGGDATFTNQDGLSVSATFDGPNKMGKVKACIVGDDDTTTISILLVGFGIKELFPAEQYCDGHSIDLFFSPLPEGTPSEYLECFSDFEIYSEPTELSYGNPAGTTSLTFTSVNDKMQFAIENALWYGTVSNFCNDFSYYRVWATAKVEDDKQVSTAVPLEITVDASGDCVNGLAHCCESFFSGYPDIEVEEFTPGVWTATVTTGDLEKNIQSLPMTLDVNPNSQYYQLVVNEEEYHSEQYEGTKPFDCYDQGFIVDSILNNVNKYLITGPTAEIAIATAEQYVDGFIKYELDRSIELWKTHSCRCSREYEAKSHLGELYYGRWECTHEDCSKP